MQPGFLAGGRMLIALVLGAAWGGWRLSVFAARPRDRFLLRWCSAVSAILAVATAYLPELLAVLHLWLAGIAGGALMLWVLGQGPVRLKGLDARNQRVALVESLLVAAVAAVLLRYAVGA